MTVLETHAAWVLVVTFAISLAYETYRVTSKAGVSAYDSKNSYVQGLVVYVVAAVVIAALFAGAGWAAWAGLVLSVLGILVSIFYYNPKIMMQRKPGLIDWIEDLVFTGLLFVAATLLFYEVAGLTLQA
jgi:hypothetical protein